MTRRPRRPRPFLGPLVAVLAALLLPAFAAAQQVTTLDAGESATGTLAAGDTARYALETGDEWFVRGLVDQETVDVVVRIVRPDGSELRQVDGPAVGPEHFQFETDTAGTWHLEVIPFEDGEGAYTLRLSHLEPVATDPDERVDQLMARYDGTDTPGAAVQVWRDGETLFSKAYGMADLAHGIPFETTTPTNIGSTSKQFTAFAVQLLAQRGELSLDDPVTKHIPELKEFEDTVRVRHLLTHTTGYREVYNLLLMTGRLVGSGDYVDRDEVFWTVENQPALQNAPGAEWNYNNTAFALAAMVVERVSGMGFHEFMEENVFGPLGMEGTQVRPHAEAIVEGRSTGYAPAEDGGFREIRDLGGAVGAGAIYATVEDLQTWAENYEAPRVGTPEMIEEMRTSFVTTEGDTTGYGLGLFIDEQRGLRRVHHGGADIAHRSMLAMYPEIRAGVTVQSNHAAFNSAVAFELAELFFEDAMEPEEEEAVADQGEFDASTYDPEEFDRWTGRYALDAQPAFILTLSRDGETLQAQATGQPTLTLTPTADTVFAIDQVEASLVILTDGEGEPEALLLRQAGQEQRATRIESEEDSWAPTREEMEAYAGRYLSREVETFYTVRLDETEEGEPQLVLHQWRLGDMELTPGEEDAFTASSDGGPLEVAFERDRNGIILAFYLANGRTRDVRFERVP